MSCSLHSPLYRQRGRWYPRESSFECNSTVNFSSNVRRKIATRRIPREKWPKSWILVLFAFARQQVESGFPRNWLDIRIDRRIVNKFILSSTSSFFSSSTPACRGQFPEKEKRKREKEKDRCVIFFDEEVSKASLKPRACIRMCVYIEIRVLL